jgi:hypothetical protein
MADPIDDAIDALHKVGASEEDITAIIKEKFGKKEPTTSTPYSGFTKATSIGAPKGGFDIGGRTGIPGVLSGAVKSIESAGVGGGKLLRKIPGVDAISNMLPSMMVDTTPRNEDERIGDAVGQIAMMKPSSQAAAPVLSKGAELAGRGAEALGETKAVQGLSKLGAGERLLKGDFTGAAAAYFGPGAISLVGRVLRNFGKSFPEEALAVEAETRPDRLLTAGARPMPAAPDPSFVRGVPAQYAEKEQKLLTAGARPMPAAPDPSFVRGVPAQYAQTERKLLTAGKPAIELPESSVFGSKVSSIPASLDVAAKPAVQAAPVSSVVPNLSKRDIARITTLDKEMGATEAARALRHDPRFATMSAADRVAAIRSISSEAPGALPATAARQFDQRWAALTDPQAKIDYINTQSNPAVKAYLESKLTAAEKASRMLMNSLASRPTK